MKTVPEFVTSLEGMARYFKVEGRPRAVKDCYLIARKLEELEDFRINALAYDSLVMISTEPRNSMARRMARSTLTFIEEMRRAKSKP